jgi:hypothetical protein
MIKTSVSFRHSPGGLSLRPAVGEKKFFFAFVWAGGKNEEKMYTKGGVATGWK